LGAAEWVEAAEAEKDDDDLAEDDDLDEDDDLADGEFMVAGGGSC
jgi:hypothetical protein